MQAERTTSFQALLGEVLSHLSTLVNQPNSSPHQTAYAEALQRLRNAYRLMQEDFEPAEIKRFEEIGARPFFVDDMPDEINRRIIENPATPAVVQQYASDLLSRRQEYLTTLTELQARLDRIGVVASGLQAGEAEVGFTIPRSLFRDDLEGLIGELEEVRFIIRPFSEAATGSAEPVIVRQISTTDPLFFFSLALPTVVMLGDAVHWVLDTWKKVEEIRQLRAKTRGIKIENAAAIVELCDAGIKKTVDAAVEAKVKELAPPADGKAGRPHEVENHMRYALESLFARIERGMTVEVKFLPPPAPAGDEATTEAVREAAQFTRLSEISAQLVFPQPTAEPVLALPRGQGTGST